MRASEVIKRVRGFALSALGIVALVAVAAVLGVLTVQNSTFAVGAAIAVLLIGIAAIDLSTIPVLAVPATLVMLRVGGALSVSDVVLTLATGVSLLMIRAREIRPMQPLLWSGAIYLATALPVQILQPYTANIVEWAHELVLVLGSMLVGFVIGREGKAKLAMNVYVAACSAIGIAAAVVAVLSYARTGAFEPAYLPELHKNTIGGMLAVAAVVAFARPVWLQWSRRWAYTALVLCGAGMLAAQSRQALIGAAAGVLFIALRPRPQTGRRAWWVWLAVIPAVIYVVAEVDTQLSSDNRFNSAHQRLTWYQDSIDVWSQSPVFGAGLRWWYTDRFDVAFQPPNVELEVLTSVGVVGLLGFFAMFGGALWFLLRMDPVYGTVGVAVVLTRFTQAQFDLYWVAGQASLLWIIAGICYGVQARDRALAITGELPSRRWSPNRAFERTSPPT